MSNQWTTEPPTKPGWYWWRQMMGNKWQEPRIRDLNAMTTVRVQRERDTAEWWPEPISPPVVGQQE